MNPVKNPEDKIKLAWFKRCGVLLEYFDPGYGKWRPSVLNNLEDLRGWFGEDYEYRVQPNESDKP